MGENKERNKKLEQRLLLISWCFAATFLIFSIVVFALSKPVTVSFLDIGQGDACLIQAGRDGNVLIDGGDEGSGTKIGTYMDINNVKSLDAVFVSHFHKDHAKGIEELLLSGRQIERLYIPTFESGAELEDSIIKTAREKQIPLVRLKPGEEVEIGEMKYQVLWPDQSEHSEDLNDDSMVIKVVFGETEILFTGDIENITERKLLAKENDNLDVDILKVAHHGSKTSSTESFIEACSPEYAVISVGKNNKYKEPAETTLECLEEQEVDVWRTDRDGTVVMTLGRDKVKNVSYTEKWWWGE